MSHRKKSKHKKFKHGFAGVPRKLMNSAEFNSLSGNGVKLLLELCRQYRGNNNGDLTIALSVLINRGFKSRDTINRAKKQLEEKKFIIQTRHGKFLNPGGVCALYALTWQPIDECSGKHDERPTIGPYHNFWEL